MGRSNDNMSDWLIRLDKKRRQQSLLSSKRKLKSNLIKCKRFELNVNLIRDPLFIKSKVYCGIYGDHHKNTCPLEDGLEITILKANGRTTEKRMCLKEQ